MNAPLRLGMLNENLSGHVTFHRHLVDTLRDRSGVELRVEDAGRPSNLRRALTLPWPLREGWDFDLALFRNQVGQSVATRRQLRELCSWADVVHLYTQNVSPLNVDLLRDKPFVITSDGTAVQTCARFPFRYPGRGSRSGVRAAIRVERRITKRASLIIAQSEWARQSFIADVGVAPDRVHVVPVGAPRPAPVVPCGNDDVRRLLFVGASMKRKGGYALIEGLRQHLGPRLELHLVTKAPVPPTKHVVVHSDVTPGDGKIDRLLRTADVFVLPTDMDMSPNAVFEAMSYGVPVVAYRSGGIPEMVADGESGVLADEGDIATVCGAALDLAADPQRARDLGERGRELLAERFDPDRRADEFLSLLTSL